MAGIERSISGGKAVGRIVLIGLIGLIVSTCGSSFQWTGQWQGKRNLPLQKGGDPSILATISLVDLKIQNNGRFELLEGGVPKSGTLRFAEGKAYLKVTHFMERPIESLGESAVKMNEEIVLSAQKDGTVLFEDPGGIVRETVTLTRQKAETQR